MENMSRAGLQYINNYYEQHRLAASSRRWGRQIRGRGGYGSSNWNGRGGGNMGNVGPVFHQRFRYYRDDGTQNTRQENMPTLSSRQGTPATSRCLPIILRCSRYRKNIIMGSSHAVRFAKLFGEGGTASNMGREIGYAKGGETIRGLLDKMLALGTDSVGAVCFIGANDIVNLGKQVMSKKITLAVAEATLQTSLRRLIEELLRVFPKQLTVCETISCRWKYSSEIWRNITMKLESSFQNTCDEYKDVTFVRTNLFLTREHYEPFIGKNRHRDFIHLNRVGYSVVEKQLSRAL